MRPLDTAIFRWINEWPDLLEPFFYAISEGNKWWPVRILLLAVFFFVFTRSKKAAVTALFSWLPANELCDLLKNGFKMPRPNVELADVQLRVGEMTSFGTASAHSANMMAVATVFWLLYRPAGYVFLPLAILTGISRIYVGVHYPYQVLLGWFVGATVGALLVLVVQSVERQIGKRKNSLADSSSEGSTPVSEPSEAN